MRLPCIICENGDPYSNIVCDGCECSIELRKETYQSMVDLVIDINRLHQCDAPFKEVHDRVKPIYDELCSIVTTKSRIL